MAQPRVIIEEERDTPRGWTFRVRIEHAGPDGGPPDGTPPGEAPSDADLCEVRLSWVDHEYWCHGQSPPSAVVRALVELLAERNALECMGPSFDAAAARRHHPSLDDELPQRL